MKRIVTMLAALAVLLLAVPASASSLFSLPLTDAAEAPNYGAMTGEQPYSSVVLQDGSLQETYYSVSAENYLAFGTLLGQKGYSVVSQTVSGSTVTVTVALEASQFTVSYDQVGAVLVVTYPAGADVAQAAVDHFPGYTVLNPGETVQFLNTRGTAAAGQFVLDGTFINRTVDCGVTSMVSNAFTKGETHTAMGFTAQLTNLDNKTYAVEYAYTAKLHYINGNNHYTYNPVKLQRWNSNCVAIAADLTGSGELSYFTARGGEYSYVAFDPLETLSVATVFDVPDAVKQSTDGVLAVTLEFAHVDTPCVIYLRK